MKRAETILCRPDHHCKCNPFKMDGSQRITPSGIYFTVENK